MKSWRLMGFSKIHCLQRESINSIKSIFFIIFHDIVLQVQGFPCSNACYAITTLLPPYYDNGIVLQQQPQVQHSAMQYIMTLQVQAMVENVASYCPGAFGVYLLCRNRDTYCNVCSIPSMLISIIQFNYENTCICIYNGYTCLPIYLCSVFT